MKGEGKELTDFALLFTAGAAAGLFMAPEYGQAHTAAVISFFASVSLALYPALILKKTNHGEIRNDILVPYMLRAAFFCTGLYCACISALSEGCTGEAGGQWFLQAAADRSASRLKAIIGSIPFRDRESNALILALITGDKTELPTQISTSFRISGASHILALSGMHLGVVYIILSRVFSVIGNSPAATRARSAMTIAVAGFYTMMTGAGASIVRAFLFITLNETARCTGRKRLPMNVFSAALIIQAALSPEVLGSVSFQLSVETDKQCPADEKTVGHGRDVDFLPDIHGSCSMVLFRHIPALFSDNQPYSRTTFNCRHQPFHPRDHSLAARALSGHTYRSGQRRYPCHVQVP